MAKRRKMSRKQSRRVFRKGTRRNRKNRVRVMRGGFRI